MRITLDLFRNEPETDRFHAGETIFSEGDPGNAMYVILEGEVDLKIGGKLLDRVHAAASRLWLPAVIAVLILLVATYFYTGLVARLGIDPGVIPLASLAALLLAGYFIRIQHRGWAFALVGVHIALTLVTCFLIMYPNVMISTTDPAYSLTIYTAASSPYTLKVMTTVALIFVPVVLAYQAWTYWVFRKRVEAKPKELTY